MDIHHYKKQIPKTMKAVTNASMDSIFLDDHYGEHKLFLNTRYDFTEFFEIIVEDMKLIGGLTYRKNRIYFTGHGERLI